MNTAFLLLMVIFFSSYTSDKHLVVREKTVIVRGKTSVGKFHCTLNTVDSCDTLFLNNPKKHLGFFLPVKEFGCGNFLINRDFQSTLNAKDYPEIVVEVSAMRKTASMYLGSLRLILAGTTQDLHNVKFEVRSTGVCKSLKAELQLQFSQFNLSPPKKFGGLIQVDNDLAISVEMEVDEL